MWHRRAKSWWGFCSVSLWIFATKSEESSEGTSSGAGGETRNDNECLLKCVIEREIEIFDIQKYQNDGSLISSDLHASLFPPLAPRHSAEKTKKKTKTKVESEGSDALRCLFSSKQRAALILAKKTHKSDVLCMAVHNHPQDGLIYLPILHGLMVSDLIHPWPSEQQGNAQPHIDYIPSAAILRASPIICF